ncbi:hypothetical protein RRG08_023197 [Elysia crispata]|uniref:Secreted protein n=1 Tax=Elysia crispata TaxID=231223 RepID=A0AAE1DKN2_9GAST|nr:hypothetical protein RRG08_023197 [Elysia crispata]
MFGLALNEQTGWHAAVVVGLVLLQWHAVVADSAGGHVEVSPKVGNLPVQQVNSRRLGNLRGIYARASNSGEHHTWRQRDDAKESLGLSSNKQRC